ncbi:MAG: glycosyltransferase family 4 protein [Candidatus Acidiferrales bacterium]
MKDGKYRVLLLCEHPVQYNSSLWAMKARHPQLDILVAYCNLRGAEPAINPGFGVEVAWDIPLLEGYPWILLPSASDNRSGSGRPGLFSKALWRLVRDGDFDAVYVGGYYFREAWTAILAARRSGIPVMLSTDVHELQSRVAKSRAMRALKRMIVGRIFRMAGAITTGSSGATAYVKSLGVPEERIRLGGNTVDNAWWTEHAAQVDRAAVRNKWDIPADASVALFCAKLQSWKRPGDLLEAFTRANVPASYLVFAGDGPLRAALEGQAKTLGVAERTRFLGFVNQSGLPSVYAASDVLVLPSEYEPFGLVVNEAMLCGCPAVVSDRVGAKYDLIREGETGYVFPCGDVEALGKILRSVLGNRAKREQMGEAARRRMESWTPEMNVAAFVRGVEYAVKNRAAKKTLHPK